MKNITLTEWMSYTHQQHLNEGIKQLKLTYVCFLPAVCQSAHKLAHVYITPTSIEGFY